MSTDASAVKVVLSDGQLIGVLGQSVDEFLWLDEEGLEPMSDEDRDIRYLGIFARHRDGGAVHKIEFIEMDIEQHQSIERSRA